MIIHYFGSFCNHFRSGNGAFASCGRTLDLHRRGRVSRPVFWNNGTLPSGEGGHDTHGTLHAFAARPAGREAKRLPSDFCRYIGTSSIITVGDGFPVPYCGTMERYRAGLGSNDTHHTLHELEAGHAGREAKRLPYEFCRYIGAISMIIVGDGFPVPFPSTSTNVTNRAGQAVTTTSAPCTLLPPALRADKKTAAEKPQRHFCMQITGTA